MQPTKSILRYHFGEGHSIWKTATYSRVSFSAARDYVHRAKRAGLSWPLPAGLTNEELKARLFPNADSIQLRHPVPDWAEVYATLSRKGQTLQLVHEQYLAAHPGYWYEDPLYLSLNISYYAPVSFVRMTGHHGLFLFWQG